MLFDDLQALTSLRKSQARSSFLFLASRLYENNDSGPGGSRYRNYTAMAWIMQNSRIHSRAWVGWHHYQSQNLQLCQNRSLIITPQTKQRSQKLTAEAPLGGEMPRASQGHLAERRGNASRGHQTANCHTESLPSAQRGSLMGCLMRPSNANGTLVVTLECPGEAFRLGSAWG